MLILPAIDILSGKCVRLFQGDYNKETVYSDTPAEMAEKWEKAGAEYIHLVDLDGAKKGRPINIDTIKAICCSVSIPCEIGGGIRTQADAEVLFNAGVARVIVGTAACGNRELVTALLHRYGCDKIVIGIDAKDGNVAVKGWLEDSGIDALDLAVQFSGVGISRFIYTDISRDGALTGPNFEAVIKFCKAVPTCQVIASGGVGNLEHVTKLVEMSKNMKNLEGVIIGKALYDNKITLEEILEIKV